jgi:hypothetical protein
MKHCKTELKITSKFLGIAVLLLASLTGNAQQSHPEYPAVKLVIDNFFESINTGNGELLASLEVEGAQILNIAEETAGEYEFAARTWFSAENFSSDTQLTERYWDEELLISDVLAVFWASYDFHVDGEFSHCGVDVLNLIKIEGEWKIGHAMWTIQQPGCEASPLGPLN